MMLFPYGTSRKVYKTPWVTYSIITINVALYIARLVALGIFETDIRLQFTYVYGSSPTYTLLTYAFVHGHLVHLFLSMWLLFLCGFDVEERMGALGFLLLYLVSVLGACILFSMKTTQENFILIGSTGGVFGVIFAYMIMFPLSDFKAVYFFFTYWGSTTIAAMYFVVSYLLLSLFYSLLVKNTVPWNQLGGAFVGIMFGTIDVVINALEGKYRPMQKRTREVREIMGIKRLRVLDSEEEPAPSEEEIEATVTDEMERLIVQKNFSVLAEKMSEIRKKQSDFCLPAGLQRNAADLLNQSGYKDSAEWAYRNLLEHYPDAPVTPKAHFYLGEILGYVKRSYSEAIDHLQSFLHSDPPLDDYKAASRLMEQFRKYHVGDVKGEDDFKPPATEPAFQKSQEASRFNMISRGDADEKHENDEEDTSPDERRKEDTAPPFSAVLQPEEIIGEEGSHGRKSLKKAEEEKEGIHTTPEKRDVRYTVILSPTRRCSTNTLIEVLSDIFDSGKPTLLPVCMWEKDFLRVTSSPARHNS